jgi:hypothetical protein
MKVRATQVGYYGHKRRREGDVFELVAQEGKDENGKKIKLSVKDQFSEAWMEPADEEAKSLRSRHIDEDQPEGMKTEDQIALKDGNKEEADFLKAEGKKKASK